MKDSRFPKDIYEILKYVESNTDTILSIDERLEFYLRALEASTKTNPFGMTQVSTGYPSEIKNLLVKASEVESAIFNSCISLDYDFKYSQSRIKQFHEARLSVTSFFIKNYNLMDRFALCEQLYKANQNKSFLAVLAEHESVVLHPTIIFKALYNSILAQLYSLADREIDAISSLMNASFFYGANIQSSAPITEQQAQNLIDIDITRRTQRANEARWQGHVEKQRQKYLELDRQRQSDLGKKLSIKDVAMWIYNNRNEFEVEYETIRNHLSKARKGEFTNN